ncbi:tRNA (adenosine(37)-N6)-threonylcarbamoyltransferase complex dimerization subunit type 1 TsaB [Crocinitomix catalasitica]|nr:tRNA (adenosine(37)-N6)-threonylcarbamoyltransferase complex dimerization subunit type 1 TsaB [Crocinitomix catalasitica]
MTLILNLETSTNVCSVSLTRDGLEIDREEIYSEEFTHSESLTVFIQELINRQADIDLKDLSAVGVSAGPGSYTGLRIGCSTAKGLCYALEIPLIAVDSLKSLAALAPTDDGLICPMFDARRMEVYSAVYNSKLEIVEDLQAKILDESSYADLLNENQITFLGPGSEKASEVIAHDNAIFDTKTKVSAIGMNELSYANYLAEQFEDTAYFEPNYLKDFIAGTPKKHF